MSQLEDKNELVSRRALLGGVVAICPALLLGSRAFAEETLQGDELPLRTTGLEHIGMVVPDVEVAARFYSSLFNPDMQKEKDPPLRYYVMAGTGYIAIGSRPNVTESKVDHYCTLVRGYDRERMNAALAAKGIQAVARGVVPDPDGIGLQLIAVPGGPGPTAVPGGRLVEVTPLVTPIGFDSIVLKVADVRRSADFYSHFFNTARAPTKGQVAFQAADTHIVIRPVASGERPGVERYVMRVAAFARAKVLAGLVALGAMPESKGAPGIVRFRDPNGLGVELKAV
ncbi:MAG TPA: VOC family protein [Steroidobacteraceae bacterium]|jgi:catechol 2,3-dioxygenase-like lactoylglutathione lyase family enzyme|nr:VOC family protein [Steroidobacteraceae bacterium]